MAADCFHVFFFNFFVIAKVTSELF